MGIRQRGTLLHIQAIETRLSITDYEGLVPQQAFLTQGSTSKEKTVVVFADHFPGYSKH